MDCSPSSASRDEQCSVSDGTEMMNYFDYRDSKKYIYISDQTFRK